MIFDQIRFLGGKLGKALADEYDVSTVGDLLYVSFTSSLPFKCSYVVIARYRTISLGRSIALVVDTG